MYDWHLKGFFQKHRTQKHIQKKKHISCFNVLATHTSKMIVTIFGDESLTKYIVMS